MTISSPTKVTLLFLAVILTIVLFNIKFIEKPQQTVNKLETRKNTQGITEETDTKVFCINLAKNKLRWKKTIGFLQDVGFTNVERFEAVNGKYVLDQEQINGNPGKIISMRGHFDLKHPRMSHESLGSPGAVGCYLSHVKLWQEMVDRNISSAIIMEDDLYFPDPVGMSQWLNQVNVLLKKGVSIDFISFGYITVRKTEAILPTQVPYAFRHKGLFWGTQAYLITLEGAKKLLEDAYPIEMQIDAYIGMQSLYNDEFEATFTNTILVSEYGETGSDIFVNCRLCWIREMAMYNYNELLVYAFITGAVFVLLTLHFLVVTAQRFRLSCRKKSRIRKSSILKL